MTWNEKKVIHFFVMEKYNTIKNCLPSKIYWQFNVFFSIFHWTKMKRTNKEWKYRFLFSHEFSYFLIKCYFFIQFFFTFFHFFKKRAYKTNPIFPFFLYFSCSAYFLPMKTYRKEWNRMKDTLLWRILRFFF